MHRAALVILGCDVGVVELLPPPESDLRDVPVEISNRELKIPQWWNISYIMVGL